MSASPAIPHGYEALAELRRGPLGVVYRAHQVLSGRQVALRLIDERARGGGRDLTGLIRSVRDSARTAHPHLLTPLEVGEDEGQFYVITELPPGPSLRQRLAGAPLPPAEAAALVAAAARAVQHLHDYGVLHLGLSSQGVFLADSGAPVVGDVGLAALLHDGPGPYAGDPAFAAPEQLAGRKADARADVYGLGCLLHECLTGSPFPGAGKWQSPRAVNPACPPGLDRACRKALAHRSDRRQATAAELAEELERCRTDEAPPPGAGERALGWARERPLTAALFLAVVLAPVAMLAQSTFFSSQAAALRAEAESAHRDLARALEEGRAARAEQARLERREAEKVRAAEAQARLVRGERDRERDRAEEALAGRRQAEKEARQEAGRRGLAEQAARDAEATSQAAVAARAEAAGRLVRLHVGQGALLLDAGDLSGALVPFTRALSVARQEKLPEDAHRLRVAAVLSRCPQPLAVLAHGKGDLATVRLGAGGDRLLLVVADGVVTVRAATGGRLVGKRLVHGEAVPHSALSPDGKRVLTADAGGRVHLWSAEDGAPVFEPLLLEAPPLHVGFSGDGKRFVILTAAGDDGSGAEAQVRDTATGEAAGEAVTAGLAQRPVALSADGKRLLACCTDRAVRQFDVATGKQAGPALDHPGDVLSAAFAAGGRMVLTGADVDQSARVWDAATGKLMAAHEHDLAGPPAQIDDGGRLLLAVGKDGAARAWDVVTGKRVGPELRVPGGLRQAALSPDGRHALLAGAGGTARVLDVVTGEWVSPPLAHGRPIRHAALSADGGRAMTADDRAVRVWGLTAGEPLAPAARPAEENVTVRPDGARLARRSGDTVQAHDAATGRPVGAAMKHKGEVQTVVYSPAGDLLLTVANPADATAATPTWDVRVWDAESGLPLTEPLEHLREVRHASFATGGTRLLTIALDKRARLWEARTGKRLGGEMDHAEEVALGGLSPDGRRVVTTDAANMTRAWDAATGERVGDGMGHAGRVLHLAFSDDGRLLATCCEDGTARVWDLATGRRLFEVEHAGPVLHASFGPDGKLLLTASGDGTARAWELVKGLAVTPPLPHATAVQQAAFSADGRWLLTAAGPAARIWDARTGEPVSPPLPHGGTAVLTHVELTRAGELVTAAGPGTRWARRLAGDDRADADLADLARLLSGREEAAPGRLAAVGPRDLEAVFSRLGAGEVPPARLLAWARRGAAECEERGLWAGAARHLDALLRDGGGAELHARRGRARAELGQLEGAIEDYGKALSSGAGRREWWAGRGEAALALGRFDRAAEDLARAVKEGPRDGQLWRRLGRAEAERGRWKEAAAALAQAARFSGDDAAAWHEQALAQLSCGDEKGYRRTCERLAKKFGGRDDAPTRRCVTAACVLGPAALADYKALLGRAETAARAAPEDGGECALMAALLLRAGEAGRAADLLAKAPARAGELWLLALARRRAGRATEADATMAQARKAPAGQTWQERQTAALWRREAESAR